MLEPIENQYIQIGFVAGSHGVEGEVIIDSQYAVSAIFDEVDLIYLQDSRRDLFPARVTSFRADEKNKRTLFFVKLLNVQDRSESDTLKGCPVYVEREPVEELSEITVNTADYKSFEVRDQKNQTVGQTEEVLENPAHPILKVKLKNDTQLLIPLVDEYVNSIDEDSRIIYCQNLDQLIIQ